METNEFTALTAQIAVANHNTWVAISHLATLMLALTQNMDTEVVEAELEKIQAMANHMYQNVQEASKLADETMKAVAAEDGA